MTRQISEVLGPVDGPPARRPRSVRRTSTVQMTWPDGILHGMHLAGRCRDLLTPSAGEPVVLAQAEMRTRTQDRQILEIAAVPAPPRLQELVGVRAGGSLRGALAESVPELRDSGDPLYLLLDDIAGASLVGGFVMFKWRDALPELADLGARMKGRQMIGICSGFRPGASSLDDEGYQSGIPHRVQTVSPIEDPQDPWSWHQLDEHPPMAMRRSRRIDVWLDGDALEVDAMFRDHCWQPDGTEIAVHEYRVLATGDRRSGLLTSVVAEPRVLPYAECPAAASNVGAVEGVAMADLRQEVLRRLQLTDCCTHLNDALRALAEVPVLATALTPPDDIRC